MSEPLLKTLGLLQDFNHYQRAVNAQALQKQIENKILAYDWSRCVCVDSMSERWQISNIRRIDNGSIEYPGVDIPPYRSITGIFFTIALGDVREEATNLSAYAIYEGMGKFLGFSDDSTYTNVLGRFCVSLFQDPAEGWNV